MTYHLTTAQAYLLGVLALWELFWKGLALWRAARNRQTAWYVVMLVINTAGVLPIIYLLLNKDRSASQD